MNFFSNILALGASIAILGAFVCALRTYFFGLRGFRVVGEVVGQEEYIGESVTYAPIVVFKRLDGTLTEFQDPVLAWPIKLGKKITVIYWTHTDSITPRIVSRRYFVCIAIFMVGIMFSTFLYISLRPQ